MPMYPWIDKNTEIEIEVLRDWKDYEESPTEEEATAEDRKTKKPKMTKVQFESADWQRLIGSYIKVTHAQGSQKGKMNNQY